MVQRKALVLAGGGSKGAFEVGVLQRLMGDQQNDYELLCGTSVGAINAAYLAQTALGQPQQAIAKLRAQWDTVTTDKVHKRWFPFGRAEAFFKTSVYDSEPIQKWIRSSLDANAVRSSGRRLRIVAVSFGTGESFVANEQTPDLPEWVIASSAFPVMLTPASIGGDLWTDGGLRNVTPLGEAIRAGAEDIDVVLCSDPFAKSPFAVQDARAIPQLLLRSIDIMNGEVSRADLRIAGLKNDLSQLRPEYRKVKIRLFQPAEPLPYDPLDFDPGRIRAMIDAGYAQSASFTEV
ncbi:MAG TPA: patatin-like phospholipase family protein [Myxococcales bacterium]|nr:patatin-like phospholipase family protein [Myxococcales bacterium]